MFKKVVKILFWVLIFMNAALAAKPTLTLDLQDASLPESIRLVAKYLQINVVIDSSVKGVINVSLINAEESAVFNALLAAANLAKMRFGNVWLIAPQDEIVKKAQQMIKRRDLNEDAESLSMQVLQIRYAKAKEIVRILNDEHSSLLTTRGRLRVDERTNSIFVQDIPGRIHAVQQLVKQFDVPLQQILIEARLVSIDSDVEKELGLQFALQSGAKNGYDVARANALNVEAGKYSLAVARLADGSLLDVKLSALENAGQAELISRPSLFAANHELASIESGEEVPYQEVSESGGTAVVFKKAVLGLKVTPQVLPGKQVLLRLQINQDRPSNKIVLGMPTISTRQMLTSVLVQSGHTIVLGGIYETNRENGSRRVPFVSQLPVLGWLFKQEKNLENKRELLIFVTPTIVASSHEDRA